mgnify:CR=1 FL=1
MSNNINLKKVIAYWTKGAALNYDTAKFLYKGARYADSLFFCHLTLEKALKSLVVQKIQTHAPHIHDLLELADLAGVVLTQQQREWLIEITRFNIAGRYDQYKFDFYKKCDAKYTGKFFKIAEDFYLWFKKQI